MTYESLINHDHANTYALLNLITAEVYTTSCDTASCALRQLYRRGDSIIRECRREHIACHVRLVNARTSQIVAEFERDFELEEVFEKYFGKKM